LRTLLKSNSLIKEFTWWIPTRMVFFAVALNNFSVLWQKYYEPFVSHFLREPDFDPWTNWIAVGGSAEAFPYGWAVLGIVAASMFLGGALFGSSWVGFLLLLLTLDLILLVSLQPLFKRKRAKPLIRFFSTSAPLTIVSLWLMGVIDHVPLILLILGFFAILRERYVFSGLLLGVAISAKLIVVIAVVPVFLYLLKKHTFPSHQIFVTSASIICSVGLLSSPLLYSPGFRSSLAASESATGPLGWGIVSDSGTLLLLPLLVLGSWYVFYRLKRLNDDLLLLGMSTPMFLVANMPGAPVGWSIWSLPLLVLLAAQLPLRHQIIIFTSTNFGLVAPILQSVMSSDQSLSKFFNGTETTMKFALALAGVYILWRELVAKSDFVRLHSRPALVLIAGDSGVGKDTLAEGIERAIGPEACVRISGDDYHKWDRGSGVWTYLTHLNPKANDLDRFFGDTLRLASGLEVENGHYDHRIGRRLTSTTAKSREFVIASGLHALTVDDVASQATLRVFLEMSDNLREDLKIARDSKERGHSVESIKKSMAKRIEDGTKFIEPQKRNADLIVRSAYANGSIVDSRQEIELTFISKKKIFDERLVTELTQTCSLEADTLVSGDKRAIKVMGAALPVTLSLALHRLQPRVAKMLGENIAWSPGAAGIVQFVTMVYLSDALERERLI